MALSSGTFLGPYEIVAAVGMGEVYRARDTRLKRDIALKILPQSVAGDPDRLARFQREVEVLAALNHPNAPVAVPGASGNLPGGHGFADASRDGRELLFARPVTDTAPRAPMNVLINWTPDASR